MTNIGTDYPIYGLQARGIGQREELPKTLDDMAADYIEQIRTVQPKGPYHLLGWSWAGMSFKRWPPSCKIKEKKLPYW